MQYLLDTHTIIWFCENDKMLSKKVASEIVHMNNVCFLSVASLWEIAIKFKIGKLQLTIPFEEIYNFLSKNNIRISPLEFHHLQRLLNLDFIHRDPFDRVIIAQAIAEDLIILTIDKDIIKYPVKCLW